MVGQGRRSTVGTVKFMRNVQAYAAGPGPGQLGPETLHHSFASRRGHERAFRRWTEMRHGRACPSIEDLEPANIAGPGDMLMDLRNSEENPRLVCIGGALLQDCGKKGMTRLSDIPCDSFLGLLTAHHRKVSGSREPSVFEGERQGPDGPIIYRAILLPLSSDGKIVDFIYGSIGWRAPAGEALAAQIESDVRHLLPLPAGTAGPPWPAARSRFPVN